MLFRFIKKVTATLSRAYELRKYNPDTIAEYFRKQGARIGKGCRIIPTQLGTEPYLIKIGDHVGIAQGVKFMTHDGGTWIFRNEVPDLQAFGPIIIEDNSIIGQNAILFPGIRIGKNSIVGAGSVVIADVPPDTIVMGVPARPFGSVIKYKEKCLARWETQRPPDIVIEEGKNWWTSKHMRENSLKLKQHLLKLYHDDLT
jgi:acetyltransferase-like isoleucine patch superfamily enzyme